MEYLSKKAITNKRVLLRSDFNVPIKDGVITDDSKIKKSLKTINFLLENNNKVIILSHFGRIKLNEDKAKNSLKPVYEYLKKYIDLDFIKDPFNLNEIDKSNKSCFLVENTRYTDLPEKKESKNDLELAKYWSSFADVFVIDAFASLHRAHSSTAGLSKFLPTYIGFLVEDEINKLDSLITINKRPFIVIMGGAKVDDKIGIIKNLIVKCDNLIITGGILNTFLKVEGYNIGASLVSKEEEVLISVREILNKYKNKIKYSSKFIVDRAGEKKEVPLNEIKDDDIIYDNIIDNWEIINKASLIFFNGTCGKFEEEGYTKGTKDLLDKLAECSAEVYIGGGDTVSAVNKLNNSNNFTYISSGGGATLEYVAYGKLKAIEFIKESDVENS